jgi:hypothetical protein
MDTFQLISGNPIMPIRPESIRRLEEDNRSKQQLDSNYNGRSADIVGVARSDIIARTNTITPTHKLLMNIPWLSV